MDMRKLGQTGIEFAPLVLGGNVFGWTADTAASNAILDGFLDAGFNAIDTADVYSSWVPGHVGGESETVIGDWMKARGARDRVVLITKAGWGKGLSARAMEESVEASLKRLQTDRIDVYFSHRPDAKTPIEETLEAHGKLIKAGKVRFAGGSNYDAAGLGEALKASGQGRARYEVLQPHYNLLVRDQFEGELETLCVKEGLGVIPYFSLASGFLTGKYRSEADLGKSARGGGMKKNFDARGLAVLAALDRVSAAHGATQAQVALAWLMARPSITAPIASATSVDQLRDIVGAAKLRLTDEDRKTLDV
ncbi:MAG: aldo/keto reductase [Alphaproteobacteria bacterium]|nr:aldo/keto reductase [Alphaproteobacteria bacterium]